MTDPVFVIDKQFLQHEGGTKFYQILRVLVKDPGSLPHGSGGRAVTVTNWGPLKTSPGLRRIVTSGQTKVSPGDTFLTTLEAKKKRGYEAGSVTWGETKRAASVHELKDYLFTELGASDGQEVLLQLGIGTVASVDDDPDDLRGDKFWGRTPPVDDTPAAASTEGWGEF